MQETEIEKFNRLAPDFWDTSGIFKALHQMNPLRVSFIKQQVDLNAKTVLDFGCGGGILSEALAAEGALVTAIDLSEAGILAAKQNQAKSGSNVDYQCISADALAETKAACFDLVCCMEVLEHVDDIAAVLDMSSRLLKPGGYAFFSTLNKTWKSRLLGVYVAEAIGMAPKGAHDYHHFIKPSTLVATAKASGLEAIEMRGIRYRVLKDDFVLSADVDINYIVAFRKVA